MQIVSLIDYHTVHIRVRRHHADDMESQKQVSLWKEDFGKSYTSVHITFEGWIKNKTKTQGGEKVGLNNNKFVPGEVNSKFKKYVSNQNLSNDMI